MADRGIQLKDTNGDKIYPVTTTSNVYTPNNKSMDDIIRMLDNLYPIGSVYISLNSISPASLFGGTWQELPEGYALWTTTTSGEGGNTISAGLPNITGSINIPNGNKQTGNTYFSVSGSFTHSGSAGQSGNASGAGAGGRIGFNANSGASVKGIYGNSDTVQPPAIKIYAWERVE